MNPLLVAILKIVVLEALLATIVVSFLFERDTQRHRRAFGAVLVLITALAALGYVNLGAFRWEGGFINQWEQFHFFLGSKYFHELGYDGIYAATVVAANERAPGSLDHGTARDPMTFGLYPVQSILARAEQVKQRFTPKRWREFSGDLYFFDRQLGLPLQQVIEDHGNTGSPAWAALAWTFSHHVTPSRRALLGLSLLDVALLLGLLVAMVRSFGLRPALITFSLMLLVPRAYDFLGGSLLRLDWLAALGLTACALRAGRRRAAGAALAWAIAAKPFCALFALALGARFLWLTWRHRSIDRGHVELVLSSVATLLLIVAVSSAIFGGVHVWVQYFGRLQANLEERYYWDNHGLRDLYLQAVTFGPAAVLDWAPDQVATGLGEGRIEDHRLGFGIARGVLISLLLWVMTRHDDDVYAFALGALWVWVVFVTNMYYWQLIALPVLAWASSYRSERRSLAPLLLVPISMIAAYVFVNLDLRHLEGWFGSWWLGLLVTLVIGQEVVAAVSSRFRREAQPVASRPAPARQSRQRRTSKPAVLTRLTASLIVPGLFQFIMPRSSAKQ